MAAPYVVHADHAAPVTDVNSTESEGANGTSAETANNMSAAEASTTEAAAHATTMTTAAIDGNPSRCWVHSLSDQCRHRRLIKLKKAPRQIA